MDALGNDAWTGRFVVETLGRHEYTVEAWVDRFASWQRGLARKVEAGQDVASELLEGAEPWCAPRPRERAARTALAPRAGRGARRSRPHSRPAWTRRSTRSCARRWRVIPTATGRPSSPSRSPSRSRSSVPAFGAWYEMFPRSCRPSPARHGTLRDVEARLAYVAGMGFDVLYLPPIHPIGRRSARGRTTR